MSRRPAEHRRRPRQRPWRGPRRDGVSLLEAVAAVTILGLTLVGISRLLILAARQTRSMSQRRWEIQEADNLMELAADIPWDQLTRQRLEALGPPSDDGEATVAWQLVEEPDGARRIQLRLLSRGAHRRPLELVLWRYRPDAAAEPSGASPDAPDATRRDSPPRPPGAAS